MYRYPDSVRNEIDNVIRAGTTAEELTDQFGMARGTAYRFLQALRDKGENVAFIGRWGRLKEKVVARFAQGASIETVHEELYVHHALLYRWRDEFEQQHASAADGSSQECAPVAGKDEPSGIKQRKLAEPSKDILIRRLKAALAEKTMEVDFFRGALREVKARRRQNTGSGEDRSTLS